MSTLTERINNYSQHLEGQGLLRQRQVNPPQSKASVHFDSNDYLSLRHHDEFIKKHNPTANYPLGSGGSMLLSGYHEAHVALERAFATFLEADECIVFSSGYAANLAMTALLGQVRAHCLVDKAVHASIYDGLSLAGVKPTRFIHNNMEDLAHKLKLHATDAIITEGIFSMSGQVAPLQHMAQLSASSALLVDEAHSFGLLGKQGQGAVAHAGLTQKQVPLRVIPLGKAMAGYGAVVAGQKEWITGLLQAGRSLIYSTAISPMFCAYLLDTLKVLMHAHERREKLQALVHYFRGKIQSSSLTWLDSVTPIQRVQLGCPHRTANYVKRLEHQGIYCSAVRAPTVAPKATGLRIVLNYMHKEPDIDKLFDCLEHITHQVSHG